MGVEVRVLRERRLEMALEMLSGGLDGAMSDLDAMKASHPPSKRGSRYQRSLESLEQRLNGLASEVQEARNYETTPLARPEGRE